MQQADELPPLRGWVLWASRLLWGSSGRLDWAGVWVLWPWKWQVTDEKSSFKSCLASPGQFLTRTHCVCHFLGASHSAELQLTQICSVNVPCSAKHSVRNSFSTLVQWIKPPFAVTVRWVLLRRAGIVCFRRKECVDESGAVAGSQKDVSLLFNKVSYIVTSSSFLISSCAVKQHLAIFLIFYLLMKRAYRRWMMKRRRYEDGCSVQAIRDLVHVEVSFLCFFVQFSKISCWHGEHSLICMYGPSSFPKWARGGG